MPETASRDSDLDGDDGLQIGGPNWGSVLIVDDDPGTVRALKSVLERNCRIFSAHSGKEALEVARACHPDLIVLDLQLPDIYGLDVCRTLKATKEFADVPVVVITQYGDEEKQTQAYSVGAADFVHKPINGAIVRARVSNLLAMRSRLKEVLRLSDTRWRFALEGSESGMWEWDLESNLMTCSSGLATMLKMPAVERQLSRGDWREWTHPDDRARVESAYAALRTGEARTQHLEYRLRTEDGAAVWVSERSRVLEWGKTAPVRIMAVLSNTTARRSSEQRLVKLTNYDGITDLPNRDRALQMLSEAIERSGVTSRTSCLLRIDLSGLARVNQQHGRLAGDDLLRQAAERLEQFTFFHDQICRFGGNEFAFIADDLEARADSALARQAIEEFAQRIVEELERPYRLGFEQAKCRCIVGAVLVSERAKVNDVSPEDVIRDAEIALAEARARRVSVAVFDSAMADRVEARTRLLHDLEQAVFTDQIRLAYQPIVDSMGNVVGAEGLARWMHPGHGEISPATFIPLAEESGLIVPLGSRLRRMACEQLIAWSRIPETAHLQISVNVSPAEFHASSFVRDLLLLAEKTPVNPALLQLELTESLLLEDFSHVLESIRTLDQVGISFSLDDFGTGYSSMRYLKTLPFRRMKIDRSFVRDILHDPVDASLTNAIIGMAKNLGLDVVAEGVEEESQARLLSEMGCSRFQGYLYGRPGPADAILKMCQRTIDAASSPIHSVRNRSAPPSSQDAPDYDASILMVDDDVSTLQVLGRVLSNYPQLRIAKEAKEALKLVQESPPDLLILDAQMPDMDGFELWDAIRVIPALGDVPAIFITAFLDPELELKAYMKGASDFVNKPISATRIKVAVRNQLRIKRQTDFLRYQASRDPLTGIPNRRSFDVTLRREVSRSFETGSSISLLMVDVDHFKSINDRFGHPAGDRCLQRIATLLQDQLRRPIELAARYGGEEFALILPLSALDHAVEFAERIVHKVASTSFEDIVGVGGQVTVSVGYASVQPSDWGGDAAQTLLELSDEALLRAKNHGRNRAEGPLTTSNHRAIAGN